MNIKPVPGISGEVSACNEGGQGSHSPDSFREDALHIGTRNMAFQSSYTLKMQAQGHVYHSIRILFALSNMAVRPSYNNFPVCCPSPTNVPGFYCNRTYAQVQCMSSRILSSPSPLPQKPPKAHIFREATWPQLGGNVPFDATSRGSPIPQSYQTTNDTWLASSLVGA